MHEKWWGGKQRKEGKGEGGEGNRGRKERRREGRKTTNPHLFVEGPRESGHESSSCGARQNPHEHAFEAGPLADVEDRLHEPCVGCPHLHAGLDHVCGLCGDGSQ